MTTTLVTGNPADTAQELACAAALSHTLLSSSVLIRLVKGLGSASRAWEAPENLLLEHLKPKQVEKLGATRKSTHPESLLASYHRLGIEPIAFNQAHYPQLLSMMHDPPFLLFVRGSLSAFSERSLAIVGTRRCKDYGHRVVETLVKQLAPWTPRIVSGLAAGIDTFAHRAALDNGLPTVAVFGTGIDQVYPKDNERLAQEIMATGGALISEYPMGIPGDRYTFPKRNRIIAGLSQGTLVVEGDTKSGALITARYALEENRQVFAVPGSIFSPASTGPNQLIQEGAVPVLQGTDIAQALNWIETPQGDETSGKQLSLVQMIPIPGHLSPTQRSVLKVIGHEPVAFDEIQAKTKEIPITELQTALTMLELEGLITALPGARFCRN